EPSQLYQQWEEVAKRSNRTSYLISSLPPLKQMPIPDSSFDVNIEEPTSNYLPDLLDENIPTDEVDAVPQFHYQGSRTDVVAPQGVPHNAGLWMPPPVSYSSAHSLDEPPQQLRPFGAAAAEADFQELQQEQERFLHEGRDTPIFGQLSQSAETVAASEPDTTPPPLQAAAAAVPAARAPPTFGCLQQQQQPAAAIAIPAVREEEEEPAPPPASPPPPDPQPHSLLELARPSWKMIEQQAQPPQLLHEETLLYTAPPAPKSAKNLLAKGGPPVKTEDAQVEERKAAEGDHGKSYDRYVRRLGLERRNCDGRVETAEMLAERDRLVNRREMSKEALAMAAEDETTRAHSHDGHWRLLERGCSSRTSRWFRQEGGEGALTLPTTDRSEAALDPAVQESLGKRSESQYTNDSLVSDEVEADLHSDKEELHWKRGFVLNYLPTSETRERMELEIFTLQGRRFLNARMDDSFVSRRVKFALLPNGEAIVRKASYSTSGLFSVNLRHGKLIRIDSTAIVAYRHPGSLTAHMMWSDDIGLVAVRDSDVSKYDTSMRRTLPLMEPLRVVQIKMQAEHGPPERYLDPTKWHIHNIGELTEESELEAALHDTAWPRLAQRVDDLVWTKEEGAKIYLRSRSFPDRLVMCRKEQWSREERDERCRHYRKLRFSAVMVPHEPHREDRVHHWQCLVLAPLPYASIVTEGRIFNYRPLNSLVALRKASLPEGWKNEKDEAPYKVVLIDIESR
ncbi:hypothetical protein PMAYCL1PPCAC_33424, partial [Pristionchus mayeri]